MALAFVWALQIYALIGLVFSVPFLWRGAARLDPAAATSPLGFRLIILPGVVALWPLLAWRWVAGGTR
jgi:hypothetical protein